jgi:hypothetical protein
MTVDTPGHDSNNTRRDTTQINSRASRGAVLRRWLVSTSTLKPSVPMPARIGGIVLCLVLVIIGAEARAARGWRRGAVAPAQPFSVAGGAAFAGGGGMYGACKMAPTSARCRVARTPSTITRESSRPRMKLYVASSFQWCA